MPATVFDQFTAAPPADPSDPWASNYAGPIARSTLAWCTVTMLADQNDTGIYRQALAADAGTAQLMPTSDQQQKAGTSRDA
ncbi:hypothetical protein ACGFYQ_37910 [Streptomyces sp. NPDC048258]|uniref:hypothetical protein n=1 Tax=Streptomyces sp. NPDC048258 TaxID=3365527 RepID=UPI003712260F